MGYSRGARLSRAQAPAPSSRSANACTTSPGIGKRPAAFFENSSSSPSLTSKTPPRPLISSGRIPNRPSIESARPAARGK